MNWRDTKDQARRTVHETFLQAATYKRHTGDEFGVDVRVFRRDVSFGNYDGIGYADMSEADIELVFLVEQFDDPQVGETVTLNTGEVFRIDNVLPVDGITVKVEAHEE